MVRIKESSQGVQIGNWYGSREVLGPPFSSGSASWRAVVRCKCGRISAAWCHQLANMGVESCNGCTKRIHGKSKTAIYSIYKGIISRCYSPKNKRYDRYGERGIKVCKAWLESFEVFETWANQHGYAPGLQIGRKNNDLGYCPDNCEWVTQIENANNKSNNRMLQAFGETKTMAQWSRDDRCKVSYHLLVNRLVYGWDTVRAMSTPKR